MLGTRVAFGATNPMYVKLHFWNLASCLSQIFSCVFLWFCKPYFSVFCEVAKDCSWIWSHKCKARSAPLGQIRTGSQLPPPSPHLSWWSAVLSLPLIWVVTTVRRWSPNHKGRDHLVGHLTTGGPAQIDNCWRQEVAFGCFFASLTLSPGGPALSNGTSPFAWVCSK